MADKKLTRGVGRRAERVPLRMAPNLPTFDCDEIVHIERMGDRLKVYFAGHGPISKHGSVVDGREAKVAIIWPIAALAKAIRQVEAAAAATELLTPDDYIGEPEGNS